MLKDLRRHKTHVTHNHVKMLSITMQPVSSCENKHRHTSSHLVQNASARTKTKKNSQSWSNQVVGVGLRERNCENRIVRFELRERSGVIWVV